jgi:hypothetical protein
VIATREQAGRRVPSFGPLSQLWRQVAQLLRLHSRGAMPQPVYQITSARRGVRDDIDHRTRLYLLFMSIRMGCFLGGVVAGGWLRWLLIVPALFLPYLSVVFANGGRELSEEAPLLHDKDARAARTGGTLVHIGARSASWIPPVVTASHRAAVLRPCK